MTSFKIKFRELNDPKDIQSNVLITAKNTDTLEEYQTKNFVNPDYLSKIQYWIEKSKFTCDETSPQTLHLNIDELFDFSLEKT
jgi:hypothetical protein